MVYALIFSSLLQIKNLKGEFKKFPLRIPLLLLLLAALLTGILDSRLALFLRFYRPLTYFLESFSVIFLTYIYINKKEDFEYFFKKLVLLFALMGVYGVINLLTGQSQYYAMISKAYGVLDTANLNMTEGRGRFRIASFTNNPIYYGYLVCVILLVITFLYSSSRWISKKKMYYGIFFLLICNLFLTNSRTPLVAFIIGTAIFLYFSTNLGQKIKVVIIGIFLVVMGVTLFPDKFQIVDDTISTFTSSGSDVEGSSVAMREVQLAASIVIFNQSPIIGHGFKYIIEGLGFGDTDEAKTTDLKGFESYSYVLLIEQGSLGIAANIIFFFFLFAYLIKNYKKCDVTGKKYIILTISILCSFLLFILGTGALGTFLFVMSIVGILLKAPILYKKTIHEFNPSKI